MRSGDQPPPSRNALWGHGRHTAPPTPHATPQSIPSPLQQTVPPLWDADVDATLCTVRGRRLQSSKSYCLLQLPSVLAENLHILDGNLR